ncbi:hypothetical protein CHO01_08220 [Cellulomonas hominis]|uniref:Uncharacterized protein n=1 Tax=Cellulomonas hominis TaxID=156981 RepID=A0A511F8U1_9CELL|nr:hypothetical protein CHO01_08220 [Cellulomonas hominis]
MDPTDPSIGMALASIPLMPSDAWISGGGCRTTCPSGTAGGSRRVPCCGAIDIVGARSLLPGGRPHAPRRSCGVNLPADAHAGRSAFHRPGDLAPGRRPAGDDRVPTGPDRIA